MHDLSPRTILLVEDQAIIALDEKTTLEGFGYSVLVAASGESAVETVRGTPGIDLVLMDIDLGTGMDGTEAARRILEFAHVPVVFLTSHSEQAMVEKVKGLTRYGYMLKNCGDFVLRSSLEMAFELFEANRSLKRSMESLRDSEAKFRRMFDQSPIGAAMVSLDHRFLVANDALCRLTGYSPRELSSLRTSEITHSEDVVRNAELSARLLAGEIDHYEMDKRYLRKDGSITWIHLNVRMMLDEAGRPDYFLPTMEDISESRRAAEALRESENYLHEIFDSTNDAIFVNDADTGGIIDVNRRMCEMYGYSRDEALAVSVGELSQGDPPWSQAEAMGWLRKAREEGPQTFEWLARKKDGSLFSVEVSVRLVLIGGKSRFVVTARDITAQKRAEAEIDRQRNLLGSLVESASGAIFAKDREGRYSAINETGARMLGYAVAEVLGRTDFELVAPAEAAEYRARDEVVMESGQAYEHEEAVTVDGAARVFLTSKMPWMDGAGATVGIIGISIDITERMQAEERARLDEERYRAILENIGEGVAIMDRDERFVFANGAAEEVFGAPPGGLQGASLEGFVSEEQLRLVKKQTEARSRGEKSVYEIEIIRPDGARRSIIVTAVPQKDAEGAFTGTYGVFRDITERKRAEGEVRKLLEEKELILREVHHRVKNNLGVIKSYLYLQAMGLKDLPAAAALREAESRVQSMLLLYDRLYQAPDFREISVVDYLPRLVDDIVANFPIGGSVSVVKTVADFVLDAKRMQSLGIIANELLTNTMKYAFEGREGGTIAVSAALSGGRVVFAVQDDGKGMPETVDFGHPGGFGLTLVDALAKQLDGSIRMERGGGTRGVLEFER